MSTKKSLLQLYWKCRISKFFYSKIVRAECNLSSLMIPLQPDRSVRVEIQWRSSRCSVGRVEIMQGGGGGKMIDLGTEFDSLKGANVFNRK